MLYTLIWVWVLLPIWAQASQEHFNRNDNSKQLQFEKYSFNRFELKHYRETVKDLFHFAHENYLQKGYPYDELRPIACIPKTRNFEDPDDEITNDVLGNFSVTLVDSLTTLAVMNDRPKFAEMVKLIEDTFPNKFNIDSTVQVFETTIRIVGGLISAHLYATDPSKKVYLGEEYKGSLLQLAKDMADRLLPSYLTLTGLPVPRINLRSKFDPISVESVSENNVAAMVSPIFEFTMLSYLTLDSKYADVTRYAMNKTWALRTELQLLPMSFNPQSGQCYTPISGVGASIDSFYEYALKGAILFDDDGLLKIWQDAYNSLNTNSRADWFYTNVQSTTGQLQTLWIDSLSAFFPGLQVLAGDVEDAILKHMLTLKLWNTFGGVPERWDFQTLAAFEKKKEFTPEDIKSFVPLEWYPLRPEFVESTYFLYRATRDPFYLNVGVAILESLQTRFKHECGFGGFQDVTTGEPQDRMETFILSETLKYLYLLFDVDNELHSTRDNVVFSTEAHPMWLTPKMINNYEQNKYFNDTVYREHLRACRKRDRKSALHENERTFMGGKLLRFAKSLFTADQEPTKDISTHAQPEPEEQPDASKPSVYEQMCFPVDFAAPHTDKPQWLHSHLLSHFDRLFEIDRRYNSTLIRPKHMQNVVPMELQRGFYEKWAHDKFAHSRPMPSTEALEIVLDLPGECQLIRLPDGSIHRETLGGRNKIRLEKIEPGKIDVYGRILDPQLFVSARCKDVFKSTCDKIDRLYTPSLLYRATVLNGINLPADANLTINRKTVFKTQREENTFRDLFGQNSYNQLMLECTPIINMLMQ
ncbi:hypothetical protein ZYGR_0Z00210 [Zygosaccharomyces rouxii]|uniref:alpha-1,2-Mannosidase n=2 Tax=Zygosaccharomyces rouxii TaxID=4956 RepID=C5E1Q7_ZYGRC|nr:uncharacterized protein ZYRO0G00528g [Zygosaccharomyces rouxii]KAH9202098.1 glycoside hydrolase [Zygosaccharomyces rouxii]GAV50598.1 hypothetical protein ZYGR_0Z00210 [Zygosaccharomyces rouxii]CAR29100.1 ZYRO0G00528p [Zygosaccharomyces rouxii]